MNARKKLNEANINGALVFAGIIAAIAESWTVFIVTLLILIALSVHSGGIRPNGRHQR